MVSVFGWSVTVRCTSASVTRRVQIEKDNRLSVRILYTGDSED